MYIVFLPFYDIESMSFYSPTKMTQFNLQNVFMSNSRVFHNFQRWLFTVIYNDKTIVRSSIKTFMLIEQSKFLVSQNTPSVLKRQKGNIICAMDDVRGDALRQPHGTTPDAVK